MEARRSLRCGRFESGSGLFSFAMGCMKAIQSVLDTQHNASVFQEIRGLDLELSLFEASDRLGGTIQTERRDGFLVECGPDSFLSEKPWALELCRRLGVEGKLVPTDDRSLKSWVNCPIALRPCQFESESR